MPHFLYGIYIPYTEPHLYGESLGIVTDPEWLAKYTTLGELTPRKKLHHVARLWHIIDLQCTALSWIEYGKEQTVFMPHFHDQKDALAIARQVWGPYIPSPTTFRIKEAVWQIT